ncbi:BrnA antitoxin family protein [Achromobacter aloeverae]|nr:BrnA antitoxin family protein [Achromobacter aloeverae]
MLQSIDEALTGQYGRVHTPAQIVARRRGRPVSVEPKVATTIRFDAEVIQAFKATGRGWQTRINDVLKDWLRTHQPG